MKMLKLALAGAVLSMGIAGHAFAQDGKGKTVGVSWSNFQEERWKTDEAAIKKALDAQGAKYISADAQSSAAKQLTDVESLITPGRRRADHPGPGFGRDRSGRAGRRQQRHPGGRL